MFQYLSFSEFNDPYLNFFTAKSESLSFKFCNILQIYKIPVFDLFTKKARKLKVAESNQAKASLTKPWLATDEANRSPVV